MNCSPIQLVAMAIHGAKMLGYQDPVLYVASEIGVAPQVVDSWARGCPGSSNANDYKGQLEDLCELQVNVAGGRNGG